MRQRLVAGIDSSTQQTKLVVVDLHTGVLVRSSALPHPDGTELDPEHWWAALHGAGGGLFTANRGYCDGHVKGWKVDQAGNLRTGYVGRDGTEPVIN